MNTMSKAIKAMRKPYRNSMLKNLDAEQQAAIMEYLMGMDGVEGHTYAQTVKWLAVQGIHTNRERLKHFRLWYALREKLQEVEAASMEMAKTCKENGWLKTAKEERDAAQVFFNRLAINGRDPKLWSIVERLAISRDKVILDEMKFDFEKKQKAGAKQEGVSGPPASAEEKEQVVKQILGIS
jgi:hypothetical protein